MASQTAASKVVHKYDWFYPGGEPGFMVRRCSREKVVVSEAGVALQASYKWAMVTCSICLGELEVSRTLLVGGDPDWPVLAALWERSGGAHVLVCRASKNWKMYRRLVLWIGAGASTEELLALKGDLGGTLLLAPRRRWIAQGALARRLCQGILPHIRSSKKERLRDLLAGETAGCASPKVKVVRPKRVRPPRPARTRPPKTRLPKTRLPEPSQPVPIPLAPTPARDTPASTVVRAVKKDPVPTLGLRPPPIAPQRGPWRVVDAAGTVLAQGPDRRRAEELADLLGGRVVPAGQVASNKT